MKFFSWVPNFLTICNLLCGCAAILMAMQNNYVLVFWLVISAAIFDFCDGFAARMLRAYSPMGKELDSLADMVSFGVVPSFVCYSLMIESGMGLWSYGAFFIAAMSALRLAKFNIDTRQSESFIGMPTPACALFVVSCGTLGLVDNVIGALVVIAILGGLLVCEIPMFSFKFKSFGLRENALRYFFAIFAVILVATLGYAGVAAVIVAYVLISCTLAVIAKKK